MVFAAIETAHDPLHQGSVIYLTVRGRYPVAGRSAGSALDVWSIRVETHLPQIAQFPWDVFSVRRGAEVAVIEQK